MSHSFKFLFVDDNHANNHLTKTIIRIDNLPIDAVFFQSVPEALDYLKAIKNGESEDQFPDVICSDINLPKFDGHYFADQISEHFAASNPDLKVYFLTSTLDDSLKEKIQDKPIVKEIFEKPFSIDIAKKILPESAFSEI